MVQHTLYVFGGQHTQQGLIINIVSAMNVGKPVPEIWLSWPCSIYALPGEFSQYALQLDTLGELDKGQLPLRSIFEAVWNASHKDFELNLAG